MKCTRPIVAAGAIALCVFAAAGSARAAEDKQLQSMKGSVSYQHPNGAPKPLAVNASIVLADKDFTITGASSLADIGLPDSSRVLVGSESKVQLAAFNAAMGNAARFVVVGKVRFIVEHPAGARANYTFQTPTANVSVRGTEGDIESQGNDLRVNVYEVCDASEPVTVTTKSGQTFQLVAGQSLVAQIVNGIIQAKVEQLTQQMIDQFSPDFGVPTSWDAAKGEVIGYASGQAAGALDNVTGGYGSTVVGAVSGLFGHKRSTPAPSPSPKSDTCTHK